MNIKYIPTGENLILVGFLNKEELLMVMSDSGPYCIKTQFLGRFNLNSNKIKYYNLAKILQILHW